MSDGKNAELVEFAKTLNNVPWCDDYEKMISGIQHNPWVPELLTGRFNARKMMQNYNHIPEDATAESVMRDRDIILRQLFGCVGKECLVEAPMTVEYGGNISVGNGFYANVNLVILDSAIVFIGNRVWFGPSVSIFTAAHDTDVQSRRDGVEYTKGVTIGDDCWIGGNVTIVPGVTIGKGCTVGAGSTVTKDIPNFSVAVGSPARVIKQVSPAPDVSG